MTALGAFAPYALAEVVTAKHKGPEVDSLGAFVCARKRVGDLDQLGI
jgi:hypothetical protein